MAVQSLKSALAARVDSGLAFKIGASRLDGGYPELCPAGSGDINFDVYGRPATMNTLPVLAKDGGASCSPYTFSVTEHIQRESVERPYLPTCAAGMRGGDGLGKGRDIMPRALYGADYRGNFHRDYTTPNNSPPLMRPAVSCGAPPAHRMSMWDRSMDAQLHAYYRG